MRKATAKKTTASRKPAQHRATWDTTAVKALKTLAKQNTPTRVLALKLNRTEGSIRYAARHYGISLKPTNQRPYG